MKKTRLFLGALLLLSFFTIAGCDSKTDNNNTPPKTVDDGSGKSSDGGKTDDGGQPQAEVTKYIVSFNTNGGSSVSAQRVEEGKKATKPTSPKKTGYGFIGWFSDEGCTLAFDFTTAVTQNITLYAKWSIESYIISFNVNGGNEDIEDQVIEYNGTLTKPENPTKDGYTFGGWFTSSSYSVEYNFSNKVTKDLVLYAKWNVIPKVVKYEVGTPTIGLWIDSIGSKWMKVAIPVTNTGTADIYLGSSSFDVETLSGALLTTQSYVSGYPEYLKPGETGYYYEVTTRDFTDTNVKVVPNLSIEKATNSVIRYDISNVSISTDTYNGVKVMGRVQNNTSSKGTLVYVTANLFDVNGNLICNCFTILSNDLAAGATSSFSMTPFAFRNVTPSDVASYEIYAYPTQFNFSF